MGICASSEVAIEPTNPNDALRAELRQLRVDIAETEAEVERLRVIKEQREFETAYLDHTNTSLAMRQEFTSRQLQQVVDEREALLAHLAERDSLGVEAASAGWGTDEAAMADIIMRRTTWQLAAAKEHFLSTFSKSMAARVSSENRTFFGNLTGKMTPFGQLLTYRLMATPERIAEIVHRAVQGMGSDGLALAEVLSVSTNEELRAAAEFYSDKHGEEMKERIVKECTGMLSKKYGEWMEAICHFDRNEDGDDEAAEEIAEALYQAGAAKMMGVDEEVFQQHLANASLSRCAAVCKAYEGLHKNTLFADVERKFRGGLEDAIIARLTPPLQLYAANLTKACKGLGSDKQAIARIFGTMSLRELPEFVAGFEGGADALDELLDKETGGDLRAALAVMLAEKSPTGNNKYVNENEVDAGVVGDSFREEFLLSYDWQRAADVGRIIARDKPHHDVATNPPHERWHGAAFPLMPYVSSRGYD